VLATPSAAAGELAALFTGDAVVENTSPVLVSNTSASMPCVLISVKLDDAAESVLSSGLLTDSPINTPAPTTAKATVIPTTIILFR